MIFHLQEMREFWKGRPRSCDIYDIFHRSQLQTKRCLPKIPIFHLSYGWGTDIDPSIKKEHGIVGWSHQKEANGLERRDNWLAAVLDAIPKLKEKYIKLFKYGS